MGNYNWYEYNTLEEAMTDNNIITSIFDNNLSMNYLVANSSLISDIKNLENYSSTLVPKLLETTLFTNYQKYQYKLPFYLYNNGDYDNNLFSLVSYESHGHTFADSSYVYENRENYILFDNNQYPNGCSTVKVGSDVTIVMDGYSKLRISISYYNSSFIFNNSVYNPNYFGISDSIESNNNIVDEREIIGTGIYSVNISNISGNYVPYIRYYSCYQAIPSNGQGGHLKYNVTMQYNRLWLE